MEMERGPGWQSGQTSSNWPLRCGTSRRGEGRPESGKDSGEGGAGRPVRRHHACCQMGSFTVTGCRDVGLGLFS